MEQSLVNKNLLEKNIEKINFYAEEEVKCLNKILEKLISASSNYKDTEKKSNGVLLSENVKSFYDDVLKIKYRREQYVKVLKQVIVKYENLAQYGANMFNQVGDE